MGKNAPCGTSGVCATLPAPEEASGIRGGGTVEAPVLSACRILDARLAQQGQDGPWHTLFLAPLGIYSICVNFHQGGSYPVKEGDFRSSFAFLSCGLLGNKQCSLRPETELRNLGNQSGSGKLHPFGLRAPLSRAFLASRMGNGRAESRVPQFPAFNGGQVLPRFQCWRPMPTGHLAHSAADRAPCPKY